MFSLCKTSRWAASQALRPTTTPRRPLLRAGLSLWQPPAFVNAPVKDYARGSPERAELTKALEELKANLPAQIPLVIGGAKINENLTLKQINPCRHREVVAEAAEATPDNVNAAIDAALRAKPAWEAMPFEDRAVIFLRACELIEGPYRQQLNAASMLGQGKNVLQAEIDIAVETCDFLRAYIQEGWKLHSQQPAIHAPGSWNRMEYRPLEGFVYAIAPFNFTALAATLVTPAALMGNVVVWKPSPSAVHTSHLLHQILIEAGLPRDVIQFVTGDAEQITATVLQRRELAGLAYTGSTAVFRALQGQVGAATAGGRYASYPRVVGETGGKNFHLLHASADVRSAALHTIRSAFEYQGQKCASGSRAYVPASLWPAFKAVLVEETRKLRVGPPEDYANFVNAVIHERAFDKLAAVLEAAQTDPALTLLVGGRADKSEGYYVHPTVYQTTDPRHDIMVRELFGPVLGVYVYDDADWSDVLRLVDTTSDYALTGSIFARDQEASRQAQDALKHSSGMLYLNTKSTGSVVGQQPFGGSRASGTNDKSGTAALLQRWTSVRTVKEEFGVIDDVLYPSNK
ncbi:hypothetical protein SEUCBS139899_010527 [Sporothrix eucalyptigena]